MGLNKKRQIRLEQRQRLVSTMLLRHPGLTQREICDKLAEQGFVNPDTDKPYSLGTINGDVQALIDRWREEASQDISEFKWRQLAELDEVKRVAWNEKDVSSVMRAIKLQMDITGTPAPKRHEITHTWQDDVIDLLQRGEIDPDEVRAAYPDLATELFTKAGIRVGD